MLYEPTGAALFNTSGKKFTLSAFSTDCIEDAYDEIEILGFPVTISLFELIKNRPWIPLLAKGLINNVRKTVEILGCYITYKHVRTVKGENMAFGTFIDQAGNFFDTTHFPNEFIRYPFTEMVADICWS